MGLAGYVRVLMAMSMWLPALALAEEVTEQAIRVGRYSAILPVPTAAQNNPLQTVIEVQFPDPIHTVGDALRHVLQGSGYRLAQVYASDPAMTDLLSQPLPEAHRGLGPLTLEAALTTLTGPTFRLVIDPLHRLLSFEVRETYRGLMKASRFYISHRVIPSEKK